mgnify:CR=1 FL=1
MPAAYLLEARGMTAETPNRAWYTGCTQCKKPLQSVGLKMNCEQHGENKGKKVYSGQLLLADLSHKTQCVDWSRTFSGMRIWTWRTSWRTSLKRSRALS